MSINRQIDKKKTMQVIIDSEIHKRSKIEAARRGVTLRSLAEGGLIERIEPIVTDDKQRTKE